jgi:hypothetical protein
MARDGGTQRRESSAGLRFGEFIQLFPSRFPIRHQSFEQTPESWRIIAF